MAIEASTGERERTPYRALDETTMCGAFQAAATDYGDRVAIRTKGDELSMTWAEYADKVERLAAGLAGLGLGRGDTMAIC